MEATEWPLAVRPPGGNSGKARAGINEQERCLVLRVEKAEKLKFGVRRAFVACLSPSPPAVTLSILADSAENNCSHLDSGDHHDAKLGAAELILSSLRCDADLALDALFCAAQR
jgi:hypothetical protein